MRRFALALLFVSAGAAAQDGGLAGPMQDFKEGRNARAAVGFRRALDAAADGDRAQAEYFLAQSLERLGLAFGAFFHYAAVVRDPPSRPHWLEAVEGAALAAWQLHDDVVAPNLFEKIYDDRLDGLAPERLATIRNSLSLLAWRAGRYEDAARLLRLVPDASAASPQARYLRGLLQQRTDPEKALETFRGLAGFPRASGELRELSFIALGRTLYGLHRYAEASAAYERLPRFSRHWDEALFEGAYADLQKGDPGAALGKLHSLHSPHLRDEFAPESLNLTAIIYHQRCLYPQARNAIFDLGGPQALSCNEVMTIFERVMGKPLTARRAPAFVFRIALSLLKPFSPAAADIMGINYLSATVDSVIDMEETAGTFGVKLTSAEEFLRGKMMLPD